MWPHSLSCNSAVTAWKQLQTCLRNGVECTVTLLHSQNRSLARHGPWPYFASPCYGVLSLTNWISWNVRKNTNNSYLNILPGSINLRPHLSAREFEGYRYWAKHITPKYIFICNLETNTSNFSLEFIYFAWYNNRSLLYESWFRLHNYLY